jgi:hypothetical protein
MLGAAFGLLSFLNAPPPPPVNDDNVLVNLINGRYQVNTVQRPPAPARPHGTLRAGRD